MKDIAVKDIALVEKHRAAVSKNLHLMEWLEFLWQDYQVWPPRHHHVFEVYL